jgi:predicted GIY-YIG superfamily endonuclease
VARDNDVLILPIQTDPPGPHDLAVVQNGSGLGRRQGGRGAEGYERFEDIRDAIQREKTIKHWPRAWKVRLIHAMNPEWEDLYETLNR